MQHRADFAERSENELRMRASVKVARRRAFKVSATVLGSLILLNLYFYSRDHRSTWLLLDAVFAGILVVRAWYTFGSDHGDEHRVRLEMDRMRRTSQHRADDPPSGPGSRFVV
jgi:hypothetical protein